MRYKIFALLTLIMGVFLWSSARVLPGSVLILGGDSVEIVGKRLSDAGIIRSEIMFKIVYKLFGHGAPVYPGIVEIDARCGLVCVVGEITTLQQRSVRLTFKEGEDIRDLANLIEQKQLGTHAALYALVGAPAVTPTDRTVSTTDFIFLKDAPSNISLEGYLFPDTYAVSAETGLRGLVHAMLQNFDRKFTGEMRTTARTQNHSIHDVVSVASILEKEVRGSADRKLVADILWRRLSKNIGLQVDSSVNYAVGSENKFTSAKDRATNSLWNTYKFRGLPLGPISNPGLDALQAALAPTPNENWFYLTSPDGTVYYARTLQEHVANKKFLK